MSHHLWFEHFKEQLQGLTEAFEQSGTHLSLLAFAIKEQRLSPEAYLQWAMTHHRLPLLQSRFFTETPVSQEMFAKWATHYPWSAECLPVAEWDGSLIVACLQPPQDFPSFPSSILVLANYDNLEQAWQKLHPERQQSPVAEAAPEGIDLSLSTPQKQNSDSFSFEDLGVSAEDSSPNFEPLSSEELSVEGASEEKLDGLFDGPTVVRLEALAPNPAENPSQEAVASAEAVLEIPETELKTTIMPLPTTPAATAPGVESAPAVTLEPVAAQPLESSAPKKATPPPPPKSELSPPLEDSFSNRPIAITPRPAGVAKPTINPVASGHFALDKIKKKNAAALNDKVRLVLSEMKAHFEKSMILTLDDQETQMIAFAWDENFKGMKDTSMRFPLQVPSIFSIVASTQKPYHGYISLNETNEKFFEDWNQGRIPDHVTITPIIINEKLVGMLMGFAEKSAYNKVSLNLAEKLSNDFTKGLQAA